MTNRTPRLTSFLTHLVDKGDRKAKELAEGLLADIINATYAISWGGDRLADIIKGQVAKELLKRVEGRSEADAITEATRLAAGMVLSHRTSAFNKSTSVMSNLVSEGRTDAARELLCWLDDEQERVRD